VGLAESKDGAHWGGTGALDCFRRGVGHGCVDCALEAEFRSGDRLDYRCGCLDRELRASARRRIAGQDQERRFLIAGVRDSADRVWRTQMRSLTLGDRACSAVEVVAELAPDDV
jgi:hypothetical protein